jgi:hypothetical protein
MHIRFRQQHMYKRPKNLTPWRVSNPSSSVLWDESLRKLFRGDLSTDSEILGIVDSQTKQWTELMTRDRFYKASFRPPKKLRINIHLCTDFGQISI